ncbi:MAG: BatD family protein [Lentisphaeria bacterium]|nr:BatD family protein [Lentisphaeria bacterium]
MKYFWIILFLAASPALLAVEADLRPSQPMAGEVFQLLLTGSDQYPAPEKLPEVKGIQWLTNSTSRSYRNINGQASFTLGIAAIAARPGTYQIPSFPVKTGKKKREMTPAISLKVLADDAAETENSVSALSGNIRLQDDRKSYYLGEEVGLTVHLFIRSDAQVAGLSYPDLQIPHAVFRNFRQENPENPRFAPPLRRMRTVDGVRYTVLTFRTAFRSIAAGEITPAGAVNVEMVMPEKRRSRSRDPFEDDFFSGVFSSRRTVTRKVELTSPGAITFKPLPAPPAKSLFTGLVGNWQMQFRLDRPNGCKVGEIMTLRLHLTGEGGTDLLKLPRIDLAGFRVYPPETRKEPGGIVISWQIIPLKAGKNRLQLSLASFDPIAGKYQTSSLDQELDALPADRLPETAVAAAPQTKISSGEPEAFIEDMPEKKHAHLLYLKSEPGAPEELPDGRNSLLCYLLLLVAGPLVWGISLLWYRRRDKWENSEALQRKRRAGNRFKTVLRQLKKPSGDLEWEDIFRREVPPLLADHLDLPPGISAGELAEKVQDPALAEALRSAGENAYLPGASSGRTDRKAVLKALKKLFIFLLFIILSPLAGADFHEAGKAYDKGDFARAQALYTDLLLQGGPAPGTLYNLGCAAYMNGEAAAALSYFDSALRLAPRDPDILENLNTARKKLGQNPEGEVRSPGDLLLFCRDSLRPDGWLLAACAAWSCFFILLAFRRVLPAGVWNSLAAASGVVILLSLTAYFSQIRTVYAPDRAFILDGGTQLRTLPADAGTPEGGLSAGQEVKILEERGQYCLIRCGNLQGWIPAKDCRKVFR